MELRAKIAWEIDGAAWVMREGDSDELRDRRSASLRKADAVIGILFDRLQAAANGSAVIVPVNPSTGMLNAGVAATNKTGDGRDPVNALCAAVEAVEKAERLTALLYWVALKSPQQTIFITRHFQQRNKPGELRITEREDEPGTDVRALPPLTAAQEGKPLDPRDPDPSRPGIFRDHNCWKCNDGAKPCVGGNPSQCEYPHARND